MGEIKEIHASVLTTQEGFETERSGLADAGRLRFSGVGAPLSPLLASNLTIVSELILVTMIAIIWVTAYGRGNAGRGAMPGLNWNGVGRGTRQNTGSNVERGRNVDIAALIKQEISKMLVGQTQQGNRNTESTMDYAHFTDFAGTYVYSSNHYALTTLEFLEKDSWILDTGASRHMCASSTLMKNVVPIYSSVSV
ncbi:hypothetical protein DH2020_003105 [Rehmannia glutinosa]|uniref:Uncharacterized protein n=1 Tax=Rehmannia glutinosa TaxID=99300 RepID=A0ABR0XKL4_REHGL